MKIGIGDHLNRIDSDVDFLVELEPQRTLLDQIALMQSLEELLGRKVDVTEPETLHELIRDKVLQSAVLLLSRICPN